MSEALRTLEVIGTNGGAMLSIINAAEAQFRHESETRMREHALLASIRERRAAQSAMAAVSQPVIAATSRVPARAARQAWARPIGIKSCETAVCAAA
jgi:hypothetical protein